MSNGSEHIKEPAETVMSDAEKAWEAFWWSDATPVIGTREGFIAGYASRDQEVAALDAALWVAKESQRELEAERDALHAVIEKVRAYADQRAAYGHRGTVGSLRIASDLRQILAAGKDENQ